MIDISFKNILHGLPVTPLRVAMEYDNARSVESNARELMSITWSEIKRVISKSNEHAARARFEITSMISDQNYQNYHFVRSILKSHNLTA